MKNRLRRYFMPGYFPGAALDRSDFAGCFGWDRHRRQFYRRLRCSTNPLSVKSNLESGICLVLFAHDIERRDEFFADETGKVIVDGFDFQPVAAAVDQDDFGAGREGHQRCR